MKQKYTIYLAAFFCGVAAANIFGNMNWLDSSGFNRYQLSMLSFREIVYEDYLLEILFLRFKTVCGLWIAGKLLPKKVVVYGFAIFVSGMLGGIIAMAIRANGVWGIFFCLCAFFPHMICYVGAYFLWGNWKVAYAVEGNRQMDCFVTIFILILIGMGCILETYISPMLLQNLIKY